ncbi:MAG: ribbon-helix-helix protein, CopG family, partial [Pyrobaculum sp.]
MIREFDLTYSDLFRAPDRDGAVVSVRVHKKVKKVLEELTKREGLDGVSELVRYLIAGYLLGKYNIERPKERAVEPIILTVNVQKSRVDDMEMAVEEVLEVIKEIEDYVAKVRAGVVPRNPEVARRFGKKVVKALRTAERLGMEEEYAKLVRLKAL